MASVRSPVATGVIVAATARPPILTGLVPESVASWATSSVEALTETFTSRFAVIPMMPRSVSVTGGHRALIRTHDRRTGRRGSGEVGVVVLPRCPRSPDGRYVPARSVNDRHIQRVVAARFRTVASEVPSVSCTLLPVASTGSLVTSTSRPLVASPPIFAVRVRPCRRRA